MKKLVFIITLLVTGFLNSTLAQTPEERITELGIELTEPKVPVATFVNWRKVENVLYLSGTGTSVYGKLGEDLTIEEGYEAARLAGIQILSKLKVAVGDLSNIKQFVSVQGMVNSSPDFYDQPKVINGFSDLMVAVFGEKGKHTRAAVGHAVLPFNMAVEIIVTVELEEEQ